VKKWLPLIALLGVICVALGIYSIVFRATPPTQVSQPVQISQPVPRGPILGDANTGLYYRNPDNSLREGLAYKYASAERVYIFTQGELHPVITAQGYFRFYGCNGNMRVIDCAPVYEMPSSVTPNMLRGNPIE